MSTRRNGEKGQGLIEYALILILVALIVVVCLALPAILAIGWVVSNWSAIVVWGSGIIAGVQVGNPVAIFIAIVVAIVVLWLISGRRK
ncbi:MAG TPA: hypothetical protein VI791_02955 [Patescibacteria group bacterium]|nr:hypothetical protein [Patescibacteria group bacterium]